MADPPGFGRIVRTLRHRNFRIYVSGSSVSLIGKVVAVVGDVVLDVAEGASVVVVEDTATVCGGPAVVVVTTACGPELVAAGGSSEQAATSRSRAITGARRLSMARRYRR